MFINPPTLCFSLLKWPYFDFCSYVLKPIMLFFGLTRRILYIFFMGNMSHTACWVQRSVLCCKFKRLLNLLGLAAIIHSIFMWKWQSAIFYFYSMLKHTARFHLILFWGSQTVLLEVVATVFCLLITQLDKSAFYSALASCLSETKYDNFTFTYWEPGELLLLVVDSTNLDL